MKYDLESDRINYGFGMFSVDTMHSMAEDCFSGGPYATDGLYWFSYEDKTEFDCYDGVSYLESCKVYKPCVVSYTTVCCPLISLANIEC